MPLSKKEIGRRGEAIAEEFLQNAGYDILHRNWRTGHLEIDILAKKDELLIVFEVKTHTSNALVPPESTVTPLQKERLQFAFAYYAEEFNYSGEFRFDIVGVVLRGDDEPLIRHVEDAF